MRKHRQTASRFLLAGCRRAIKSIRKDHYNDGVYGFVLTIDDSGAFASVAVRGVDDAAPENGLPKDLEAMFREFPRLKKKYQQHKESSCTITEAVEWQGWAKYCDEFDSLTKWLTRNFDGFYDDGYEPEQIGRFFETLIVSTIKTLKSDGAFKKAPFEKAMLLGAQSHDPSNAEFVIRVSSKVNGKLWHSRVAEYFAQHVD